MRTMTFQRAKVSKALGSVSQIVSKGNRCVFEPSGSYIQNLNSGEKIWLRERNGVCVLDVMVGPPDKSKNNPNPNKSQPFQRQDR